MITEATPRPNEFPPPEQQESAWSLLLFAWRRKSLVVLMVLVGLGLGYLYFLRERPVYQSTAQILLVHRHAKLPIEGLEVSTGYDSTHEILIRSPMVAKLAVEKNDIKSLSTLSSYSEPWVAVVSGLNVSSEIQDRNSGDILELSYSSKSQSDCQKVLAAVISAYQDFLGDTYKDVSQEAIDLINKAKDELDTQIKDTQADYEKFLAKTPVLPASDDSLLSQIATVRNSAVVAISTTQARIRHIEAALKRGGSREALTLMVGDLQKGNNPATTTNGTASTTNVEEQLFPLLLQEEILLNQYGKDHPKVTELRARIEKTRQHLLGLNAQATAESDSKKPERDFFELYLASLNEQIKMNEQTRDEMDELFAKESDSVKQHAGARRQDENYRESISSKRDFYKAVVKRLEEIELVKDNNSVRVQVIHEPGLGLQIKPDLKKIMSSAGMLGMLIGLGLAFAVDRADRRFRGPDEIRNDLGLPVVGHIPVIPALENHKNGKASGNGESDHELSPVLRMVHQPRGRIAEAYRAVRTALYFSTRGTGHKVIQITSPSPGDGKTTLACNLAISIANSGKKSLLLDADFRRPRCHRILGVDNSVGVTDILDGTAELDDVLQETQVENLYLLPCGKRPENPSEMLISPQFEQLLGVIREKFDFVIIDTPPVLAVTDPLNVVSRVDGVLLCIRLTKKARASSRRALTALEEMGADMLGVVVNGIGGGRGFGDNNKYSQGKYGYGNYGYGYGYGGDRYQYGGDYDYRYSYDEGYTDNHYYEDADETTKRKSVTPKAKSHTNGKA